MKTPRIFHDLTFTDKVRAAMPMARTILVEGLDPCMRVEDLMITARLAELTRDNSLCEIERTEAQDAQLFNHLEAAFALGIAAGLMLRPEAFEKGGAR